MEVVNKFIVMTKLQKVLNARAIPVADANCIMRVIESIQSEDISGSGASYLEGYKDGLVSAMDACNKALVLTGKV